MATDSRRGWRARKHVETVERPVRVLTASSKRLDLADKKEARQLRVLRQGWQSDAWNYRDSIGELRYAIQFLANSSARMRLFAAAEPMEGESDDPVPLSEIKSVPEEVISLAEQAMRDLGRGRLAYKNILKALSTNISVAGECFMLGRTDEETGKEDWSIRSVDEIIVKDDSYQMREMPDGPQGIVPWVPLDPELNMVSRIWIPHPRFALLADSPLKAMLDDCDSITIMRRMIRAEGRSRTSRGILKVPDGISIKVPIDDDEDPEADQFMNGLTQALMEPIGDEGVASAVAPIVIRGSPDALKELQLLTLAQPFEEAAQKVREELIGIIATSFDLPKEVIQGVADLNHWSAWQVDDNTFRHHIEPHVIELCDALTGAYLRPYLINAGVEEYWADRVVFWYDPTELVTHPDQTADAMKLHEALVISDEALLRTAGFNEADAPSKAEVQVRLLEKMRTWPPNLVMAFLHQWDPTLVAPPITTAGMIPGIKPGGVDVGVPPVGALPAPAATPAVVAAPTPTPAAPPTDQPTHAPPPSTITASGERLSRRLVQIDRDLRTRLQTAANAAMLRQLERVGNRLRSKVAKDETLSTKIAHRRNERVSAILGKDVITAAGINATDLMGDDWSALRAQFYAWTEAAQKQAISAAVLLAGADAESEPVKTAELAMSKGRDQAWGVLAGALTSLGHHLLYNPDPNAGPSDWADLNPDTLVPTGMIRAAMAVAGGGTVEATSEMALSTPVGQIGTGATIEELLTSTGMEQDSYTWEHGPSLKPFDPHLALDGTQFATFDSEALANTTGFPDNEFYFPGDHQGCLCDFAPNWVETSTEGEG